MSDQSPPADVGRATGFRLAARDQTRINQTTADTQTTATNFEAVRQRNRAFAAARGHEGAVVFPKLGLFVITCLDPRTDPAHFLGLGLSDAMVIRNVGGRVTPEVIEHVAFIGQLAETALPEGPLVEVAVIHHTQCGTCSRTRRGDRISTPTGSASTNRRCSITRSWILRPPSPAMWSGCGLRPRSRRV